MKQPEEWKSIREESLADNVLPTLSEERWIKQIQLDSYKQACTDMAELCRGNADWAPADNEECADAIISARDNKTTI